MVEKKSAYERKQCTSIHIAFAYLQQQQQQQNNSKNRISKPFFTFFKLNLCVCAYRIATENRSRFKYNVSLRKIVN